MVQYIYGFAEGYWHALARHDPEYRNIERVSEKLTAEARKKDPEAPEVMVVTHAERDGPGHGRTLCRIENLPLDKIGVDPEEGDPICPACSHALKLET
jgi:hypothetical protein